MRDLKIPSAGIVALLAIALMMLPMPAFVLDALFTFNIGIAMVILLVSLKTQKALDFSVFPTALLLTTLLRLSLNVASTRLILAEGHTGASAAGHVVEAFGTFLLGGNFLVGFIVFAILLIINFAVITKGAGRIAEVSARFALDALPGKQMAIDADLSAGLIAEKEAKERREEVGQEADFYGAMDGASKFVRGDAVAALLIFIIGALGGILVGTIVNGLSFSESASLYFPMAVGDAIASQVPALLLSMAAGILVSKAGSKEEISTSLLRQIAKTGPVKQSAVAMGLLGVLPGMPTVPFLMFSAGLWFFASYRESLTKKEQQEQVAQQEKEVADKSKESQAIAKELSWEEIGEEEVLSMEIGYRLIPLADPSQGGDFLPKARALRKKFAEQLGFLPPALRVKDNLDLPANVVRILVRGIEVAQATLKTDGFMCLKDSVNSPWPVPGIEGIDPAFGLPALWIERDMEPTARAAGLAVVSPSAALATMFSKVLTENAKALFGMSELKGVLEWRFKDQKSLSEWVPGQISYSLLLKICKELLEESVPLKDWESILSESIVLSKKTDDHQIIAENVRKVLTSAIVSEAFGAVKTGRAYILDEQMEHLILQGLSQQNPAIEPDIAKRLIRGATSRAKEEESLGGRLVILVSDKARAGVAKLLRRTEDVRVLGYTEIPENFNVDIVGTIA